MLVDAPAKIKSNEHRGAAQRLGVGSALAAPGEKATGWIDVPAGVDDGTQIPVTVANGVEPGEVLALIAGTHGYEYAPILALQRIAARLDPTQMRGSVILVHIANPPSFYGRTIYRGPDGKNLNRVYPGSFEGTISDRIAHAITSQVIAPATHLIDLHCGDGNESLRPYSYWTPIGDQSVDLAAREMALAYGLDRIVVDRSHMSTPNATLFTSTTAMVRGKPAITTEAGGTGLSDYASVEAHVRGAMGVINFLGICDAATHYVSPSWYEKTEVLLSPASGLWRPCVGPMQVLTLDALVGRITDPFGNVVHDVRAPFDGELFYVVTTPPIDVGEPVAMLCARSY